jgi:hypothetical protein
VLVSRSLRVFAVLTTGLAALVVGMRPAAAGPGDPTGWVVASPESVAAGGTFSLSGGGCALPGEVFTAAHVWFGRAGQRDFGFGYTIPLGTDGSFSSVEVVPVDTTPDVYLGSLACTEGDAVTPAGDDLVQIAVTPAVVPPTPPTITTVAPPTPTVSTTAPSDHPELARTGRGSPAAARAGVGMLVAGLALLFVRRWEGRGARADT